MTGFDQKSNKATDSGSKQIKLRKRKFKQMDKDQWEFGMDHDSQSLVAF